MTKINKALWECDALIDKKRKGEKKKTKKNKGKMFHCGLLIDLSIRLSILNKEKELKRIKE